MRKVWSFLGQKLFFSSDFYVIADEPNSPVGLPKGLAEQVVKHAFFKWKPQETVKTDLTVANEVVPEVAAETVIENTENIEEPRKSLKVSREKCFTSSESYNGAVYELFVVPGDQ